jgi:hypothetical protein
MDKSNLSLASSTGEINASFSPALDTQESSSSSSPGIPATPSRTPANPFRLATTLTPALCLSSLTPLPASLTPVVQVVRLPEEMTPGLPTPGPSRLVTPPLSHRMECLPTTPVRGQMPKRRRCLSPTAASVILAEGETFLNMLLF